MSPTALIISGIALIAGSALAANADTLEVPAQFPTIQSAINIANPGDTVLVAPGNYLESINLLGKLIAVKSSGGPAVTAIQADQSNPSVISCISGEPSGTFIEGFTIIGGTGAPIQGGGGLLIIKSAATVYECVFAGNSAVQGGGLALIEGELMITGCTFNLNQAEDEGGAIHSSNANLLVDHCTFNSNCAVVGGGVNVHGGTANLSNCDFFSNLASSAPCAQDDERAGKTDPSGGAVHADACSLTIYHCDFILNSSQAEGGAVSAMNSLATVDFSLFEGNQGAYGGAIHAMDCDIELLNSAFDQNTGDFGGALVLGNAIEPIVMQKCIFTSNAAFDAGAGSMSAALIQIDDCAFTDNCCDQLGGALNLDGGVADLDDCVFTGNRAIGFAGQCRESKRDDLMQSPSFGGAIRTSASLTKIKSCEFESNIANPQLGLGGAIYAAHGLELKFSTFAQNAALSGTCVFAELGATIEGCTFQGNTGEKCIIIEGSNQPLESALVDDCQFLDNVGGALALSTAINVVTACTFQNNTDTGAINISAPGYPIALNVDRCLFAHNSSSFGGGAIFFWGQVDALLTNSLFESNTSPDDGGVILNWGLPGFFTNPVFINCTFAGNSAPQGSILAYQEDIVGPFKPMTAHFHNCILWDNQGSLIAEGKMTSTTMTFSDVQGGYPGEGNIEVDPLFFGPLDRRLTVGSPCVNAGNNDLIPVGITVDLNGRQRIQNGTVDMGAYEGFTCIGDIALHGNGVVDVDDLLMIISDWGCNPSHDCFADVTQDGFVDVDDLLAVINNWGPCD